MRKMCNFPKKYRIVGLQNFEYRSKIIGWKSGFNKKNLQKPKNISKLRSFCGLINQYMKLVPNLSTLCAPLRPLLNKKSTYHWNDSHRAQIVNIIENNTLDIKRPSRLKTDATGSGLGFTLEKGDDEAWITIAFTTRFSTTHEIKCSTNDFEMLGVVWATKHFKNYVYGSEFEIVTDHKALLSASNANHGNKDMHSRLKRG